MARKEILEPTIHDVAREAGVSTATVSRVLNHSAQVKEFTRWRVEEAVRRLAYRPNPLARSLKTRTTHTVALMLPDITNPFYPGIVKGVQDCAHKRGYSLLLCTAEGDPEGEENYLNLLRAQRVDGALVDGLVLPAERIRTLVDEGFPIVSLDRGTTERSVPLVQVDNRLGARLATEHLLELGHRHIAHVSGVEGLRISAERCSGYVDALEAARLTPNEKLVVSGRFTEEGGRLAGALLLASGDEFTAVFAANDISAIGVMSALIERGLRVPDDVSIIGFDDLPLAGLVTPPLTTIRQPAHEIGYRAMEVLLDLLASRGRRRRGQTVVFAPELVVRASTAPASYAGT